jgi:hypothetical protein
MAFGLAVEELILGSQVETMTNKEVAEHVHVFVRVSPGKSHLWQVSSAAARSPPPRQTPPLQRPARCRRRSLP